MRENQKNLRQHSRDMRKNMTKAEVIIWKYLRRMNIEGVKFRRQHPVGEYIADFASIEINLIIEVDGATHMKDEDVKYDILRTKRLNSLGWEVLRCWNIDIYKNLSGVLRIIELKVFELLGSKAPHRLAMLGTSPANGGR